jgi:putative transposase
MDAILTQKASELAEELATKVTTLEELDAVTRSLMKATLERILHSELEVHLGRGACATAATEQDALAEATRGKPGNRKNGSSPKTVQGKSGKLALDIPRDRNGTFEPELIGKHQRRLPGFDEKILALYAKGMTTRDIQELVKELYGVEISPTLVSQITEDLDAEVKTWQTRRLEAIWPILFLEHNFRQYLTSGRNRVG